MTKTENLGGLTERLGVSLDGHSNGHLQTSGRQRDVTPKGSFELNIDMRGNVRKFCPSVRPREGGEAGSDLHSSVQRRLRFARPHQYRPAASPSRSAAAAALCMTAALVCQCSGVAIAASTTECPVGAREPSTLASSALGISAGPP